MWPKGSGCVKKHVWGNFVNEARNTIKLHARKANWPLIKLQLSCSTTSGGFQLMSDSRKFHHVLYHFNETAKTRIVRNYHFGTGNHHSLVYLLHEY